MCLWYSKENTDELRRRMKKGKKIFYKVYDVDECEKCLIPPIMEKPIITKPGNVLPEKKVDFSNLSDGVEVKSGAINVFQDEEGAKQFILSLAEKVIPVTCDIKDLVAVDNDIWLGQYPTAAFKKIKIAKKDFDNVFISGEKDLAEGKP